MDSTKNVNVIEALKKAVAHVNRKIQEYASKNKHDIVNVGECMTLSCADATLSDEEYEMNCLSLNLAITIANLQKVNLNEYAPQIELFSKLRRQLEIAVLTCNALMAAHDSQCRTLVIVKTCPLVFRVHYGEQSCTSSISGKDAKKLLIESGLESATTDNLYVQSGLATITPQIVAVGEKLRHVKGLIDKGVRTAQVIAKMVHEKPAVAALDAVPLAQRSESSERQGRMNEENLRFYIAEE